MATEVLIFSETRPLSLSLSQTSISANVKVPNFSRNAASLFLSKKKGDFP